MIYQWTQGARISIDAQRAGERLESIREQNGRLTAALVLDDARSKKSPLHPAFEWDNARAAEMYRLDQARYVIRSVVAVSETVPGDQTPIRAFVVVSDEEEQTYTSTYAAMQDPEQRQQILRRALGELNTWQRRYREFNELATVFAALEQARELVAA